MDNGFDDLYIKKVLSGDKAAFRYFINMYQELAYSAAIAIIKDKKNANEIVQNAFVRMYKSLHTYQGSSKFSTWFYRVVVNEALVYLRKAEKQKTAVEIEEKYFVNLNLQNEGLNSMYLKDKRTEIQRVLILLKPKERLLLELYYLKEFSLSEIEEMTGFSMSNIKVLLFRARKSFASHFNLED